MNISLYSTALLGAVLVSGAALAQATPDWTAQADALLSEHWSDQTPGISAIITRNGQVVYQGVAGLADLETQAPVTPDMVFRLGSITKQFAAAVALQLIDEGALSLDDTVSDYLPDYPQPGASATVRQLLNHTSGIQAYTGIPGWMTEENTDTAYSTQELIAVFADQPANFQPGESWAYNNSGYVLLGAVIEAVTGQSWSEALNARISQPLQLQTLQSGQADVMFDEMAQGYTLDQEGEAVPAQRIHMSVPHAAGDMLGNTSDLAGWGYALHTGQVVSPALYQQMIARTELPDGEMIDYGYGIVPFDVRGQEAIGHGGGIFGFTTDSLYLPDSGIFVAVLNNTDQPPVSPSTMTRRLAAYALGDPFPDFTEVALEMDAVAPLLGVYTLENGAGERVFFERDGQLYTQRTNASESPVWPVGEDRFYYGADSLTWFQIVRDDEGAHRMDMHQQGATQSQPALRTGPVPEQPDIIALSDEIVARYLGAYQLGAAVLTIAVDEEAGLQAQLTGQPALPIQPISETEFMVVGVNARLVFDDSASPAPAVTLFQGGQDIRAERVVD